MWSRSLPLLFAAPDGIAKLRSLILGMAISGKLAAQKSDEAAAIFAFEKYRISRKKSSGQLLKRFEIPESWLWCTIADLCVLRTGATPSTLKAENYGGEIRWLVSGDIHKREIYECEGRITEQGISNSNCRVLPENSVLIALNGQGKTRATVAILRVPAACNQSLVAMTPVSDRVLLPEFLYLNLRFRYHELRDITGQKQRRGLNMGLVSELSISLPPIDEQRRIVAKVDELMALCDRLEAEQADAEVTHAKLVDTSLVTLTRSTSAADLDSNWHRIADNFENFFTTASSIAALEETILRLAVMGKLVPQDPNDEPASELLKRIDREKAKLLAAGILKKDKALLPLNQSELPFAIPASWVWIRMQSGFDVRDGTHDTPKYVENDGVPLITSKNFVNGAISFDDVKLISIADHEAIKKRSAVQKGDILYSMIGGNIGNQALVDTEREFSIKNVALFKYYSAQDSSPKFLNIFLKTVTLGIQANAAGGAQPFVSLSFLRNIPIALPPLAEQHRIVAKVDELMMLCDRLRAGIAESRRSHERLASTLIQSVLEAA